MVLGLYFCNMHGKFSFEPLVPALQCHEEARGTGGRSSVFAITRSGNTGGHRVDFDGHGVAWDTGRGSEQCAARSVFLPWL